MNKYPLDKQAIENATCDIVANDRALRSTIKELRSCLEEALDSTKSYDKDDDWCEDAIQLLKNLDKRTFDYETHRFNQKNGHYTNQVSPYTDDSTSETSFGGEMDEEEVARLFNEKTKKKTKKVKKEKKMTLEEIEAWEASQENSNDIYKVSARIKNLARAAAKANLTAQGDMVVNTFTHLIKAFYDFAETIQDKELKIKLIELAKKQEEMPANLIVALGAGVRAPK